MRHLIIPFLLGISISLSAQLTEDRLKDIIAEKLLRWETVLGLSEYKSEKLQSIFEEHEQKTYAIINALEGSISERLSSLDLKTDEKIKQLFTDREYQLYSLISEQEKMSQYDYVEELVAGYAKDEELAEEIFQYQMKNIIPRLRIARIELDAYIHPEDQEVIDGLRDQLYQTLDECLVLCSVKPDSTQNEGLLLNQLLSAAISDQMEEEDSPLNTLFKITKQYEPMIHRVYNTMEEDNERWAEDLETIQKFHIMPSHLETFKELTNVASYISLDHMKKDAFFLLSDGNSVSSLMKILRIGNHFMPYIGS